MTSRIPATFEAFELDRALELRRRSSLSAAQKEAVDAALLKIVNSSDFQQWVAVFQEVETILPRETGVAVAAAPPLVANEQNQRAENVAEPLEQNPFVKPAEGTGETITNPDTAADLIDKMMKQEERLENTLKLGASMTPQQKNDLQERLRMTKRVKQDFEKKFTPPRLTP